MNPVILKGAAAAVPNVLDKGLNHIEKRSQRRDSYERSKLDLVREVTPLVAAESAALLGKGLDAWAMVATARHDADCVVAACAVESRRIAAGVDAVRGAHAQQRDLLRLQQLQIVTDLQRHKEEADLVRDGHLSSADFVALRRLEKGQS